MLGEKKKNHHQFVIFSFMHSCFGGHKITCMDDVLINYYSSQGVRENIYQRISNEFQNGAVTVDVILTTTIKVIVRINSSNCIRLKALNHTTKGNI